MRQATGTGPITASAIAASAPDLSIFRSGLQFAAWLGLTPQAHRCDGYVSEETETEQESRRYHRFAVGSGGHAVPLKPSG
jgi:transposase